MRICVVGQKLFGAAVAKLLVDRGHEVALVCSPAFASDGRTADRLRAMAEMIGADWRAAGTLRAENLPGGTDLIVCAHAHDFIGRATRGKARLGAIGYHPSLLPIHRGRDAVRWAVKLRERMTGGTIYWLGDGVDAGDVAAQEHVMIGPQDTAEELWQRELFPLGLRLFEQVLADIESGRLVKIPQDEALATWEPALDQQPIYRPELPLLGGIEGFTVVRRR